MHTKPFCILSFLALLGAAHGSIAPIVVKCTTQAWVRAPDLTPNTIVRGDARVKISAECPAIENVSLGLRFKERSFVKVLRSREDVKRLHPERPRHYLPNMSPWALSPSRFVNKSVEEAYEETITNKGLWIVREEERTVFETTQPISMGSGNHGALRDFVQDFSILVPSTNFPPALDIMRVGLSVAMGHEIVSVEWIYEYFAQISFSNGTTKEISAGITAFQPLYDPFYDSQGLTSATVALEATGGTRGNLANTPVANYSIEISTDAGLTFFAGTKGHVVTAVVTRTGFARTFSAPLNVLVCVMPDSSPKWATEYDTSDVNPRFGPTSTSVLRATSDDDKQPMWQPHCFHHHSAGVAVIMPNSTSDEIEANEIVTTASAAFTLSIDVDDTHIPTFETYYQTLTNSLLITMETPRGEDEVVNPDDPSYNEPDFGSNSWFENDEVAWVPWEKGTARAKVWRSYSGRASAAVYPAREETPSRRCLHASTDTSGQVVLSDETDCEQRSLIHYLDKGAREPVFVDRNTIHELLAEDLAERELRAPILNPVVSSPPDGEELTYRYYHHANLHRPLIYVGETWVKKVADKDRH